MDGRVRDEQGSRGNNDERIAKSNRKRQQKGTDDSTQMEDELDRRVHLVSR